MEARHYYLAVSDSSQKMPTVAAFATAASAAAAGGLVVACSDRASLDECAAGLAGSGFDVVLAHSDLSQRELEAAAGRMAAAAVAVAAQGDAAGAAPGDAAGGSGRPPTLAFVATDAALRALPREAPPLGAPLLICLDPPTTREVHALRLAAAFGAGRRRAGRGGGGIVVHIAVAGELEAFRAAEAAVGAPISELPVHIPSLFV